MPFSGFVMHLVWLSVKADVCGFRREVVPLSSKGTMVMKEAPLLWEYSEKADSFPLVGELRTRYSIIDAVVKNTVVKTIHPPCNYRYMYIRASAST